MGIVLLLAAVSAVESPAVTGAEMDELRQWTSAKFEALAGVDAKANAQANGRGGREEGTRRSRE